MLRILVIQGLLCILLAPWIPAHPQSIATAHVRMRLAFPRKTKEMSPPSVLWLTPINQPTQAPTSPPGRFTLLQKNRMFKPHLLIIPVGSEVLFPNADPFFHNVFSLFDGKRFDLGLYEAGSTKGVTFSREGISYIFCNIHPEMSAVVLSLSTHFYATADSTGAFELRNVPAGDYELHVWVEGMPQSSLRDLSRHVHLEPGATDLGHVDITAIQQHPADHLNKFGQRYDRDAKQSY